MEQIKVNMIPNNEVKTIHCSKGDGNTRKWGFQLYKDDGAIDASSISPQMFYDSYKGGTEQVLPENTFVPTTSPIIADIQYKDALRSEQEFLYRESPATVDGKAKITKIKGNTLVWNQMIENGDFAENSGWTKSSNSTLSIANNKATVSATNDTLCYIRYQLAFQVSANHKYLLSFYLTSPVATTKTTARFFRQGVINNYFENQALSANTRTRYMSVITATVDCPNTLLYFYVNNDGVALTGDSIFEDAMLVELTLLNSSAITDIMPTLQANCFRSWERV